MQRTDRLVVGQAGSSLLVDEACDAHGVVGDAPKCHVDFVVSLQLQDPLSYSLDPSGDGDALSGAIRVNRTSCLLADAHCEHATRSWHGGSVPETRHSDTVSSIVTALRGVNATDMTGCC